MSRFSPGFGVCVCVFVYMCDGVENYAPASVSCKFVVAVVHNCNNERNGL